MNEATDVYVFDKNEDIPTEQSLHDKEVPHDITAYPLEGVLDELRREPGVRVRFGGRSRWTPVSEKGAQIGSSATSSVPSGMEHNSGPQHWVVIDAPTTGHWKIGCGWVRESSEKYVTHPRIQRGTSSARMSEYDALPLVIHAGDADDADLRWSRTQQDSAIVSEEELEKDAAEKNRQRVTQERWERSASHRREVLQEYGNACVMCGWKVTSGGGLNGVEAAHIRPVKAGGEDGPENGLPLCPNHHWMFDEGLVTFDSDFKISIASDRQVDKRVVQQLDETSLTFPDGSTRPSRENINWRNSSEK